MKDIEKKYVVKSQFSTNDIDKSMFTFANNQDNIHDVELDTKPIGYFKDAMMRFTKNKSSVVAAFIILFLVLYAIFIPILYKNNFNGKENDNLAQQYAKLLPKSNVFGFLGWDGCKDIEMPIADVARREAMGLETGLFPITDKKPIRKNISFDEVNDTEHLYPQTSYTAYVDTYKDLGMYFLNITRDEYEAIQKWQDETGIQLLYPVVDYSKIEPKWRDKAKTNPDVWYKLNPRTGNIAYTYNEETMEFTFEDVYREVRTLTVSGFIDHPMDNYHSLRVETDGRLLQYALYSGKSGNPGGDVTFDSNGYMVGDFNYQVRVHKLTYFQYVYGFEPNFVFGTNNRGHDIFVKLASGARFSFVLAVCVAAINLTIGTIYGAIEGYYGGATDIVMERIVEILGGIPFMVVTTLFQLYLAKYVGVVGALIFAFVMTGWIGMSGTVRMQFYRFKNQEYILAARTLGAKDGRIMFKHIFPNAIGTIITSCVLVIPGVIFSESSLTYLNIINLESGKWTSVGTQLALGKDYLETFPHIIAFPALFISLLEISFNLFGNGLRDAFNPSLRGSEA